MNILKSHSKQSSVTSFQEEILTRDNFGIVTTCYLPAHSTNQVTLIGSATGVHQQYYRSFAKFLSQKGYTVYTFDYRGVGKSRPASLKGMLARMQDWGKYDMEAMIIHIRNNHPYAKLTFIGHSISGQLLSLTPQSRHFAKIILVACQHVNWRLWPLYARFVYAFLVYALLPVSSHIAGYYPGKALQVFWDLPKGVAIEWASWCQNPDGMFAFHSDTPLQELNIPLLGIGFSDDVIAPLRPMHALYKKYSKAAITHWQFTPEELRVRKVGHFGFFRPSFKAFLWEPMLEWLEQTEKFDRPLISSLFSDQLETYR